MDSATGSIAETKYMKKLNGFSNKMPDAITLSGMLARRLTTRTALKIAKRRPLVIASDRRIAAKPPMFSVITTALIGVTPRPNDTIHTIAAILTGEAGVAILAGHHGFGGFLADLLQDGVAALGKQARHVALLRVAAASGEGASAASGGPAPDAPGPSGGAPAGDATKNGNAAATPTAKEAVATDTQRRQKKAQAMKTPQPIFGVPDLDGECSVDFRQSRGMAGDASHPQGAYRLAGFDASEE